MIKKTTKKMAAKKKSHTINFYIADKDKNIYLTVLQNAAAKAEKSVSSFIKEMLDAKIEIKEIKEALSRNKDANVYDILAQKNYLADIKQRFKEAKKHA